MDIVTAGSILSNPTRVRLLKLVSEKPLSATVAHEKYISKYDSKHRESIYRELENLTDSDFLDKRYSNQEQRIVYQRNMTELHINLEEMTIRSD